MIRLFHVSDLHFGREDKAALDWFKRAVEEERPDAVVCTGDLTQRARRAEFEAAGRYLESLPVPVTVEPGNHDLPYFNPFERFFRPYRRYGRVEKLIERPLDIKNVLVVPLKTTARFQLRHNWSWGVVGRRALARTLALLKASDDNHVKLVACHHPLVDKEGLISSGKTVRGREALEALAAAGAHAVLSGHVHDPFVMELEVAGRQIRKIGAGTLSERVRDSAPSFNELKISDAGQIEVLHRWMDAPSPARSAERDREPIRSPS
jgi:3',5'-cyclic AMP phosphodiesterase CpdA